MTQVTVTMPGTFKSAILVHYICINLLIYTPFIDTQLICKMSKQINFSCKQSILVNNIQNREFNKMLPGLLEWDLVAVVEIAESDSSQCISIR